MTELMRTIETTILAFFDEAAGVKLHREPDGELFDRDSNWGFYPRELAQAIVQIVDPALSAEDAQ